jgi:hypothetical protein
LLGLWISEANRLDREISAVSSIINRLQFGYKSQFAAGFFKLGAISLLKLQKQLADLFFVFGVISRKSGDGDNNGGDAAPVSDTCYTRR